MSGTATNLRYLSTLNFDDDWLQALAASVPGVEVCQISAEKPDDISDEIWSTVHFLHTSAVLPDPDRTPSLRAVQLDTSGTDHLRGTPLWSSSIPISTIGGVSPVPLAEYVMFAVLGFAHRLPALLRTVHERRWPSAQERWRRFLPAPLDGATLGILGYGRIGREIGRLAMAHGMSVVGINRSGRRPVPGPRADVADFGRGGDDSGVEIVATDGLREVVGRLDFFVVVCPLTDETRGIVDTDVIAAMKPGAVLVNVARGGIVDETALLAAVRSGSLAGAMLDVFDDEPLPPSSPWWEEPTVLVTPHVAGLAPRYSEQVLAIVSENLRRLAADEPLLNCVDRVRGY